MPNYDTYGYCCLCHRNLQYEQVIGNKVVKRFHTDYGEVEYLLDDGSRMRVAMCKTCRNSVTDDHHKSVMDSVKEGWVEQVKTLDWSDKQKQEYIDTYSKKQIVCFSDGIPTDVLKKIEIANQKEAIDEPHK